MEKRKFHRFSLAAKCILSSPDGSYQGRLENISLNGALVRFEQDGSVPPPGEYDVAVRIGGRHLHLRLIVEVVCVTNGLTGITFVSSDAETGERLGRLAGVLTSGLDKPGNAQEKIRKHLAEYLHEH